MNFTPPSILVVLLLASTSAVFITYLATRFMSRQSSALRHYLWLLSLAAPLVALALFPLGGFLTLPILPPATSAILPMPPMPQVEPVPASPEVTTVMIRPNVSETKQDKVADRSHPSALTVPAIFAQVNGWILIWFLGVLISILKRGVELLRINNFVKECCLPAPPQIIALADEIASHMLLSCRPHLLIARANQIPFCHGLFSPVVVIPEGEDITKYTVYLQHEFAHLIRRDLAALSLAQITSALCWFNPLVWFAVKMLRQESERATDDLVLSNGEIPEVYATHLVELIESCQSEPTFQTLVLAMARPGMARQRIQSILDGTVIRTRPSQGLLVSLGCAFFLLIFSSVCLRLAEAEDPGTTPDAKTMRVHVVDYQGQPIASARVTPLGLQAVGYSCRWYLPGKTRSELSQLKFLTDENGTASVPYPLGSDSNDKVTEITVKVEHPNYAIAGEIQLDPLHPNDITLFPGETLKVQTVGPKGEVLSHPFLLTDSRSGSWHYSDDGTTLISNVALPLNKNLEVMGIVEDRPNHLLFSDIKTVVSYKPGGESTLTLEMKPGQEIRGQLDPSIPRPIKNGWVRYVVERPADQMTSFHYKQSLDWDGFAAVAPDGSFVVNNVPEGIFEVIAMCDGYISKQPDMIEDSWHRVALTLPAGSRYGLVYSHPDDSPLVLPMEPTGTLQVKVQDQSGQPILGAEVVQGINQNLHGGSCFLSNGWDSSLDGLKTEMNLPIAKSSLPDLLDSRVVTDSQGLATFNNVPEIELYYNVSKKGFNSAEYVKASVLSGKSTLAAVTLTKVISK